MRKLSVLLTIFLMIQVFTSHAFATTTGEKDPLTLTKLVENMGEYEKKNISLVGTILGACGSGCKIWLGEGPYKEGNPVALVWAKDDAFKFKTNATGRKVELQGYAVGEYIDLCAIEKNEKKDGKKAATPSGQDKKDCKPPIKVEVAKKKEGVKQLKSITFFATSVNYLK